MNGGNYLILPSPAAIHFAADWAAQAVGAIKEGKHDQDKMASLHGSTYLHCTNKEACRAARADVSLLHLRCAWHSARDAGPPRPMPPPTALQIINQNNSDTKILLRSFLANFMAYNNDVCALNQGTSLPLIDLCDWAVMFLHPVCTNYQQKLTVFKHEGIWFVDDDTSKHAAPACWPAVRQKGSAGVCLAP